MEHDYERIKKAIEYITLHAHKQPTLEEIAGHIHLSPAHFQRMFSRWVGLSPKRYLQILTVEHAKELLAKPQPLLDVSLDIGLSSSSRLHDHFITLEAVTPGEYKNRGLGLDIIYGLHETPFGQAFIALTQRGVCQLSFLEDSDTKEEIKALHQKWPKAIISHSDVPTRKVIDSIFDIKKRSDRPLSVLVCGTNFQINVWKALLSIPSASLTSYKEIAGSIGKPKASRAVGTAIASNPVAFLIPCHRVIQQSGKIGGYRWGETRKHAIHAWEMARES